MIWQELQESKSSEQPPDRRSGGAERRREQQPIWQVQLNKHRTSGRLNSPRRETSWSLCIMPLAKRVTFVGNDTVLHSSVTSRSSTKKWIHTRKWQDKCGFTVVKCVHTWVCRCLLLSASFYVCSIIRREAKSYEISSNKKKKYTLHWEKG